MSRQRCTNHPSREADAQCARCGKWICEKCLLSFGGKPYCSRACLLRGFLLPIARRLPSTLRRPVPLPWAMGITAAAVAALLALTALLAARLLREAAVVPMPVQAVERPRPRPASIRGRLERRGNRWRLEITGPPHTGILVHTGTTSYRIATTDATGRAVIENLRLRKPVVRLFLLGPAVEAGPGVAPTAGAILPAPTFTASPTASPTATPTPTPTPTLTPTPTPTATASPTPTSTETPSPRPTATATPTPKPSPTAVPRAARPTAVQPTRHLRVQPLHLATPPPSIGPAPPRPRPTPARRATPPPTPRSRRTPSIRVPDLHLVRDAGPRIALTFDGGSTADGTTELLDLLQRLHLHATLFVTGDFITRYPGLLRRAVLDGHEVGNHTLSHPHLTTYAEDHRQRLRPGVTRAWFQSQLRDAEELFYRATGRHMAPLWRAPYGEENGSLRAWAWELGYLHVRWSSLRGASLDSWDWVDDEHSSLYEDSERMKRRLLGFPHLEGGIILMHLSTHRREPPWRVLPSLVDSLGRRGITPTSVTALLEASKTWRPRLETARKRHAQVFQEIRRRAATGLPKP